MSSSQNLKKQETVTLHGIETHYKVYGEGKPLLLLHGFTQSSESWSPFISYYAGNFEIYLIDLLGHGKSSPFKNTISVKEAAKNLYDLIRHLQLDSIQAIGYSYGGEILFQLALLSPRLISSMVIVGSCGTWKASHFPEFVDYLSYKNIDNLPWMRQQQENEEQIMSILAQVPNYSIEITDMELQTIQSKTLLVVGDNDPATPLDCVIKAKQNLHHSYLWIAPNSGHGVHLGENKALFIEKTTEFLNNVW